VAKLIAQATFGVSYLNKKGYNNMKIRAVLYASIVLHTVITVYAENAFPLRLAEIVEKTGQSYRTTLDFVTNDVNVALDLQNFISHNSDYGEDSRHAQILLARLHFPDVFAEFDRKINHWREREKSLRPLVDRPGFLCGNLLSYTRRGPENKLVYVRDDAELQRQSVTNRLVIRGLHRKQVEKYTDAEVEAGIERNAAARQAVLEHFLKFLHEGDAYEQSEMVKLVYELWGPHRKVRGVDLTVTDNVPDAEELIAAVFHNPEAPALARMEAAVSLSNPPPQEFQSFMLNIVTNHVPEDVGDMEWTLLNRALYQLKLSGDTNALAVLKSQTNGPSWKLEKIEKTAQSIENRLGSSSVRQHELEL
jgi:hypothetical protein